MKKMIALLLSLSMMLALVSCGTSGSSSSEGTGGSSSAQVSGGEDLTWGLTPFETQQTVRLGFFTGSPLSYGFLFADNLGVFDALNIEVEYVPFTGGPAMMEANAEWDMASCGAGGLALGLYGYDFPLVDITDYEENLALFVRPDSAIANDPTNPEVWKGTTWVYPAGTTAQAVLASALQQLGLTLNDITSVNMDNANALTGFNGGTGDGLGCWNAIAFSAEDAGYVRVGDAGTLDFTAPCGTFVQPDFLENNLDLVTTMCIVFHKAAEWCYESEENMAQAAQWYLDNCDEEGFLCNEDIAQRTMEWWRSPTVDEWIELYTTSSPDDKGLYTSRDLLQAEKDILVSVDFFISEGKYTNEDRARYLDDARIDPTVALHAQEMLGE